MSYFNNVERWSMIKAAALYLDAFLGDTLADGIGSDSAVWTAQLEALAARMVDYKCGGIARRIRIGIEQMNKEAEHWPEVSARLCGQLIIFSKKILATEDDDLEDIAEWLIWSGWSIQQKQIMHKRPINDQWIVLGHSRQKEENLRVHRTWLYGQQCKKYGLHIEYLIGFNQPDVYWTVGKYYDGDMIYYPGKYNTRVMPFRINNDAFAKWPKDSGYSIEQVKAYTTNLLSTFPLVDNIPIHLKACSILVDDKKRVEIKDDTGQMGQVRVEQGHFNKLIALAGDGQVSIFGELNDGQLVLHSVGFQGEIHALI